MSSEFRLQAVRNRVNAELQTKLTAKLGRYLTHGKLDAFEPFAIVAPAGKGVMKTKDFTTPRAGPFLTETGSNGYPRKRRSKSEWYGLSFVGVMAAGGGLFYLFDSLGYATDSLSVAVLVGAVFHTGMSMEGLTTSPEVIVDSKASEARLVKIELLAGAIGGVVDIMVLLLFLFFGPRLEGGVVVNIILFVSGALLPPVLGIAAGFPLARKILGKR